MHTFTTRTVLALAASGLLLAGCAGSGDDPVEPIDTTDAPEADGTPEDDAQDDTTTDEAPTGSDDGDAETEGSDGPGATTAEHEVVITAIATAEAETGGTAIEVDDGDGGIWEITIASEDDEIEVDVSADGTEALSVDREGSLDREHRDALQAATITISDAIGIASEHSTAGIDDVKLDEDGSTFAWEVVFDDDIEVYVDVAGGEVLRVETD